MIRVSHGNEFSRPSHYNDAMMSGMASQVTSLTTVCSTVYTGTDQRKHKSSAPLAFVRGIHRYPVNSPHKGPVTRKMFPFDDVIISLNWCNGALTVIYGKDSVILNIMMAYIHLHYIDLSLRLIMLKQASITILSSRHCKFDYTYWMLSEYALLPLTHSGRMTHIYVS